jgi:hypothetical protein
MRFFAETEINQVMLRIFWIMVMPEQMQKTLAIVARPVLDNVHIIAEFHGSGRTAGTRKRW